MLLPSYSIETFLPHPCCFSFNALTHLIHIKEGGSGFLAGIFPFEGLVYLNVIPPSAKRVWPVV